MKTKMIERDVHTILLREVILNNLTLYWQGATIRLTHW
jgi:hypothetical protein